MEESLHLFSLQRINRVECPRLRICESTDPEKFLGNRGEVILSFTVLLMSASLLYGGLFWLNKTYEKRTKEHLHDFETRWNHLGKKYED